MCVCFRIISNIMMDQNSHSIIYIYIIMSISYNAEDERWKVTAPTLHNVTTNFENGKRPSEFKLFCNYMKVF